MEKRVLGNWYKIVVLLFGAAFAEPNKGTTVLFRFKSLSKELIPTVMRRIQGLLKAFA